ncbi:MULTISPECIES: glycosyltransferase family 2 protein [unclassified Acinetobacter]|uniref:glycosyltransferase family 2 protein n=1 Tax=unclassified Acinetobacter TaxID=196816 RepID=UPI0029351058|nr:MULTISPECIES: glycosyltransferase [unclassified Acinetobacter]WOE30896.1 glycosyltransferase [Acinetobacter sp. SAAs470]WOE39091.1 glycosyltransferase [Acinetobacter sp. SAAs474]
MSMPLISVIMPVYNAEEFIEQAIFSILNQTYKNIELIICDDGSSDNTIVKILNIDDNRIRLYKNENNKGNLFTTNKLLSYCQGEYIAIQDADDYSELNRIEIQMKYIVEKNVDLIGGAVNVLREKTIIDVIKNPQKHHEIIYYMKNKNKFPVIWGSVLFKKIIYTNLGGFNTLFDKKGAADIEWMLRAIKKYKFYNINDIIYNYRQHVQSFTKALDTNDPNLILRLFAEDIAIDMYSKEDKYPADIFFHERLKYYSNLFEIDKSRLLSIYFSKLILGNINYFLFLKKLLLLKACFKQKIKYLGMATIFYIGGFQLLELIKRKIR